ncbi:MAG: hypothetical protein Q8P50_05195 [Bacillota bacterium]|nr:hypothetical protein [Bacillota bacterium]
MPEKDYRKQSQKQQGAGFPSFDKNRFMYEVADEIRAGIDEDKKKTAPGQGHEATKPFEKQPTKKAFEEKKDAGWEKKDTGCEHK